MIIPDKNVWKKKDNAVEKSLDWKKNLSPDSLLFFNFGGGTQDGEEEEIHLWKKKNIKMLKIWEKTSLRKYQ